MPTCIYTGQRGNPIGITKLAGLLTNAAPYVSLFDSSDESCP